MSSDCSLVLDAEGASGDASPNAPSWWSDSDGRRSSRSHLHEAESPWWPSDDEARSNNNGESVCSTSPNQKSSKEFTDFHNLLTSSSDSSRQLSSSRTSCLVSDPMENGLTESTGGNEDHLSSGIRCRTYMPRRKRAREQQLLETESKEPLSTRLKLDPPSPNVGTASSLSDFQKGIFNPVRRFLFFFNTDVLDRICDATNTYAWAMVLIDPTLSTEDGSWEEVTAAEMYAFLAVLLIMRKHRDVGFGAFWREQEHGRRDEPWPGKLMKLSRFFTILKVLRFSNRQREDTDSTEQLAQGRFVTEERKELHLTAEHGENRSETNELSGDKVAPSELHADKAHLNGNPATLDSFSFLLDQFQTVLTVFSRQCEIQCVEKIRTDQELPNEKHFVNCMKISNCWRNENLQEAEFPSSSPVLPQKLPRVQGHSRRDKQEMNCKIPSEGSPPLPEEVTNNVYVGSLKHPQYTVNAVTLQWQQGACLKVSISKKSPEEDSFFETASNFPLKEDTFSRREGTFHGKEETIFEKEATPQTLNSSEQWQEVFIPCSEVVYKNDQSTQYILTSPEVSNEKTSETGKTIAKAFAKSFFYHYLHLALYFTTTDHFHKAEQVDPESSIASKDLPQSVIKEDGDPICKVLDGLVLLGEPKSVLLLDSELAETDETMSSDASTVIVDGDKSCHAVTTSHSYILTRSMARERCLLCWSLHQEVRNVRTKCTRCGKHFCLSKFRNCMEEAHRDDKVFGELWDKVSEETETGNQ